MIDINSHKVLQLAYTKAKGQNVHFANEATFITDQGLKESYHGQGGDGLVVIVSQELLNWMEQSSIKGLCFKRFKYNICLSSNVESLQIEQNIKFEDTILSIVKKHKHCFASEQNCKLSSASCKLLTEVKFAKVHKGGTIFLDSIMSLVE